MASSNHHAYEYKTLDGTTIRGRLFIADDQPAATIVMTPGVSFHIHIQRDLYLY